MPSVDQSGYAAEDLTDLDLTCPSCSTNLILDDTFLTARVCGHCHRHFSMGARERIGLLVDPGTFEEFTAPDSVSPDGLAPELVPSAERLAEIHDRQVVADAVVTGNARLGGIDVALIVLDDHLIGATLGATLVEKIIDALGQAIGRKLPVVLVCSGGARTPAPGPLSVVQGGRLASAFAQVHVAGLPVLGVLAHPVAVSIHAMLATHTDILFAEPGTRIGPPASHPDDVTQARPQSVEQLLAGGWVDAVVDRLQVRGALVQALDHFVNPGNIRSVGRTVAAASSLPVHPDSSDIALQHPDRPGAGAMQAGLLSDVVELRGDRVTGDVPGVAVGFARLESLSVAFVTLTDDARLDYAAASRKVARLARFASRQERPIVIMIDETTLPSEAMVSIADNQAVASLASLMAVLPVPLLAVGIRLVASPLAVALFAADRQYLLANARLVSGAMTPGANAMSPRQPGRTSIGIASLSARECERLGLIDGIIEEPAPGAHVDPASAIAATRSVMVGALAELVGIGLRRLLDTRYRRQRELGLSTPEGLAAVHSELWEIQEWQRSFGRSLDDWRERWDQFRSGTTREPGRRIEVPDLVNRLRTRRDELLNRAGLSDRVTPDTTRRDDAEDS